MSLLFIEINVQNWNRPDDSPWWRGYDVLQAEGNTLAELIADATVFLCDQDGGEAGEESIEDTPYFEEFEQLIISEYEKINKTYQVYFRIIGVDRLLSFKVSGHKTDLEAAAQALSVINNLYKDHYEKGTVVVRPIKHVRYKYIGMSILNYLQATK